MEEKQMYIGDLNTVFGKDELPLLRKMEDIVMPALCSNIVVTSSERTKYFFEDVAIKEIKEELVLCGLLIKDTILEVKSEYSKEDGLKKTDKHFQSSPYSLFMIYLKNHRMLLVKNQNGSPDLRSFSFAFRHTIDEFVRRHNNKIREEGKHEEYFPFPKVNVSGIKSASSVKEALKDVEKITELSVKFYPLNSEWDYGSVFGDIDRIRKDIGSKRGKMTFPSPDNIDGVADMIERTDGLVKTEMRVKYKEGAPGNRKKGRIKDNMISDISTIHISGDLDASYGEIGDLKSSIKSLNVTSDNGIIEYEQYVRSKRKGDN